MRYARLGLLFVAVVFWGSVERSLGVAPMVGVSLAAAVACAFELRLGLSLLSGSLMLALGEWMYGLPVGAWALGGALGLIACHLVLHTARPGALERAVALVMILIPGMVCSLIFALATGSSTGIPGLIQTFVFLLSAFVISGPLVTWLHGERRDLWGQPG